MAERGREHDREIGGDALMLRMRWDLQHASYGSNDGHRIGVINLRKVHVGDLSVESQPL